MHVTREYYAKYAKRGYRFMASLQTKYIQLFTIINKTHEPDYESSIFLSSWSLSFKIAKTMQHFIIK